MRRIIPLTVLTLILATAGSAMADRRDGRWGNDRRYKPTHSQRHVVRHNNHRHVVRNNYRRTYVKNRRPVHVHNGHYHFSNGHRVRYTRPYIGVRYTNYYRRPVVLVENYQRVPGYIWVAGHWNWNGVEWIWISGHYAVDPAYTY